jgi:hypothetical protein
MTRLGRLIRSGIVVATVATGLVAATAAPAQAGVWTFIDGFENNPEATWFFETPDNGFGDFGGFDGTPHSGARYATVYRFVPGWSSVDRSLRLPASFFSRQCTLQGFIQEWPGTLFNLEVIDPATWSYVALRQFTIPDLNWHAYQLSWTGGPRDVVLRFVVVSDHAFARIKVDDVAVVCVTIP